MCRMPMTFCRNILHFSGQLWNCHLFSEQVQRNQAVGMNIGKLSFEGGYVKWYQPFTPVLCRWRLWWHSFRLFLWEWGCCSFILQVTLPCMEIWKLLPGFTSKPIVSDSSHWGLLPWTWTTHWRQRWWLKQQGNWLSFRHLPTGSINHQKALSLLKPQVDLF